MLALYYVNFFLLGLIDYLPPVGEREIARDVQSVQS